MKIIVWSFFGFIALIIICLPFIKKIINRKDNLLYKTRLVEAEAVSKNHNSNLSMKYRTKSYPYNLFDQYNVCLLYNGKKINVDAEE